MCTGWALELDTQDVLFEVDAFYLLVGTTMASHDILFVNKVRGCTSTLPEQPYWTLDLIAIQ